MLKMADILDEKEKILHEKSEDVTFPLSKKDKDTIKDMIELLTNSQIPELADKYCLRPGMGLAAIQLGIKKRYFVVVHEYDEGKFDNYVIINPKIISTSEEMIYVGEGEGCLSVNRETCGIVPRHARITLEAYDENYNPSKSNLIELIVGEETAEAGAANTTNKPANTDINGT